MRHLSSIIAAAVLVASLGTVASAAAPQSITIKMGALNNSGENGTATLTQGKEGVQITIALQNAPKGTAQPTHIHEGTCGKIKAAPEYALQNTVDGKNTSIVKGVQLSDLLNGTFAINVHKSGTDLGTYVSCGNIKAAK